MEDFILLNINSIEYVYIDSYTYEGKKLYHFASLYDHLLCEKKDNQFIPINNETSEKLKDYLGFKSKSILFEGNAETKENDFNTTNEETKSNIINFGTNNFTNNEMNANSVISKGLSISVSDEPIREKEVPEINQNNVIDYTSKNYPLLLLFYKKAGTMARNINLTAQNQMIFEIMQKLNILCKEEGFNFDINEVISRMQEGFIGLNNTLEHSHIDGFYDYEKNAIILRENCVNNRFLTSSKRIIAHEFIHRASGIEYAMKNSNMQGLIEGETENLVEHIYGDETSSIITSYKSDGSLIKSKEMRLNVSNEARYKLNVLLVQQMEYLLGENSYESILEGKSEFENHFIEKYGIPLFITMKARSSKHTNKLNFMIDKLISQKSTDNIDLDKLQYDEITYFQDTQDILMKTAFDSDFKKIETLDDANKFLNKLKNYENYRGRTVKIEMGKTTPDNSFEYYYNKMYTKTNELLEKKGFKHLEIYNAIGELHYSRQPSKPYILESNILNEAKKAKMDSLVYSCIKFDKMIDPNIIMTYLIKVPNTQDYCLVSTVNGITEKAFPIPDVYYTRKFIKELLKHEEKFDNYVRNSKLEYKEINFEKSAEEILNKVKEEMTKQNNELNSSYTQKKMFKDIGINRNINEVTNIFDNMKVILFEYYSNNQIDLEKKNLAKNYSNSCQEAYIILKSLNNNLIELIPDNIWMFLEMFKTENYNFNFDKSRTFNEQNILDNTKIFLSYIYLQYLCDDNEKTEFKEILEDNSKNFKTVNKFFKNIKKNIFHIY